jgi:saccharopine dehydrogenase-like NADP-dependent oxidoreductase
MTSIKTVAIIGAGGNVGSAILEKLLQTNLTITIISRPESKSTFPSAINVIKTSYDLEGLTSAFKNQDAVVCCLAVTALKVGNAIVDAAAAAGVKWFLPSEYGHDPTDPRVVDLLPVLKVKTSVVAHLKEKEREGLKWTGIITGLFFDWVCILPFQKFQQANRNFIGSGISIPWLRHSKANSRTLGRW